MQSPQQKKAKWQGLLRVLIVSCPDLWLCCSSSRDLLAVLAHISKRGMDNVMVKAILVYGTGAIGVPLVPVVDGDHLRALTLRKISNTFIQPVPGFNNGSGAKERYTGTSNAGTRTGLPGQFH